MSSKEWAAVFQGLDESLVDQVLERLAETEVRPGLCIVLGKDMPLLAALCRQWAGRIAIVPIFAPVTTDDMADVVETIALNEGIDIGQLVWIDSQRVRDALANLSVPAACAPEDRARVVAESIRPRTTDA